MSYVIKDSIQGNSFIKSGGTSSQFLMADGSVTTGGGGTIGGSGTINFVSKFSSTSNLTNSNIFDNGTNVGIGTINPTVPLYISGAVGTQVIVDSNSLVSRLELAITGITKGRIQYDNSNNGMLVGTNLQTPLIFITDNSLRGRVSGVFGNLLWNTATDNGVDNVQINGSLLATTIKKLGGTSSQFLMADGSVTVSAGTGIGGGGHPNYLSKWSTSASLTDSQIFDNFTNVMIATTNDNGVDKLQVNGSIVSSSIRVSGGTSSQFLKANGSVDSNTYAVDSGLLHTNSTTETKNGRLIINSPLNAGLTSISPNSEGVISICQSQFGVGLTAQNTGGGDIAQFLQNFGAVVAKVDYSGRVSSQAVTVDNDTPTISVEINSTGGGNGIISTNSATDNALFINTSSAGLNSAAVYGEVNSSSNINYCFQGVANGTKGRILMGYTTSSLDEMLWLANQGTGVHAPVIRSEHGKGEGVHIEAGNTGESLVINHSAGASGNAFRYTKNGTNKAILQDNGRLFLNTPFELSNFHLVQMTTNSEHPGGIFINDNTSFGQPNAPLFAGYVNNTDIDNPGLAFYAQMGNNNTGTGFRVDGNLSTRATPFIYNFGGFPKFVVTSAGTVSATSFAVNYGNNSQAQIADGSLITLSSATFTPVFANLSNVSSPTSANCSYTVIGKIVTGRINFSCSDTVANTPSQLTFTIPAGHVIVGTPSLGSGTKINGGTGANYSVLVYQNTSTTIRLYWYALSTGSSGVAAMFQYQIA